jgi:tRNA(Ile)-lysidine synthase TilS/MesJ
MARYVVAVSGGVDSVVLLHQMTQMHPVGDIVVAHFDHGIRDESADDASFG